MAGAADYEVEGAPGIAALGSPKVQAALPINPRLTALNASRPIEVRLSVSVTMPLFPSPLGPDLGVVLRRR